MIAHFVNVLVPVNLHSKDDKAIKIAIHLADTRFCVIHLLDIVRPGILSSMFGRKMPGPEISGVGLHRSIKDMLYMSELKATIERCRPNSIVKIHICKSSNLQEVIAWYANCLSVQVVIIPEIENKGWYHFGVDPSPEDIAGRTNCKILTYKDGILSIAEKGESFLKCFQYEGGWQKVDAMGGYFYDN